MQWVPATHLFRPLFDFCSAWQDGRAYVRGLVPGSAAARASGAVRIGDAVLTLDGAFCRDLSSDEIRSLTLGEPVGARELVRLCGGGRECVGGRGGEEREYERGNLWETER